MKPDDDYPHLPGPDPNFNESVYFQFSDASSSLNGFARLASRPNESHGERTVCIFMPDGTAAFSFARPASRREATLPRQFAGKGFEAEVSEPYERHRVTFRGNVQLLDDPSSVEDLRSALFAAPSVACALDLDVVRVSPPWANAADPDGTFLGEHYEQPSQVHGSVQIGDQVTAVEGHGLRDHSWGPRSWQAPWHYRWLHGTSERFAFACGVLGRRGQSPVVSGFVWADNQLHDVSDVRVETSWNGGSSIGDIRLTTSAGARSWSLRGEALNSLPLQHRSRDGTSRTRILETAVLWRAEDTHLLGIAEYLDQMVDGRPVSLAEYGEAP